MEAESESGPSDVASAGPIAAFDFAHAAPFFERYCTRCHGEAERTGDLPNLERLRLRRLATAPVNISPLADAPKFPWLNLAGTALEPGAIEATAQLATLERAFLWGTGIDAVALAAARPGLATADDAGPPSKPIEVEPEVAFVRFEPEPEPDPTGSDPAGATATVAPINTTCPVSGTPVDPRFAVVFDGRVFGFCCTNCPKTGWDDPERFRDAIGTE